MCGIAGVLWLQSPPPADDRIQLGMQMLATIEHRGPDDGALLVDDTIVLGHRRLAILDLTERGRQPMADPTERFWISYNGEIYNFQELRAELESAGCIFRSSTDTEVVLQGFAVWGEAILERLNGMFAIAIWDSLEKRLWLARDGIGIKPLFYSEHPTKFLFGSEIKAILADSTVVRKPDWSGLREYFTFGYCGAPNTGFQGIKQLEAGECLTIHGGKITRRRWYRLPYPDKPPTTRGDDALEKISVALDQSVKRQMISDVPVGAFLSGGIDSSAIVRSMSHFKSPSDIRTYTIAFEQDSFDESPFAQQVASRFRTQHQCKTMHADLGSILKTLVSHAEDPLADNSLLPTFLLCSSLRPDVKVALSGDGADELFGGYVTYRANRLAERYRFIPQALRKGIVEPIVRRLPASMSKYHWTAFARRFVDGAQQPYPLSHCGWRRMISHELGNRIFATNKFDFGDTTALNRYASTLQDTPEWLSPLEQQLHMDLRFHLPNDMLAKVDRMSMAHSLEVRVPFLDQEFIRTSLDIEATAKHNGKKGKLVLRNLLSKDLPSSIVDRPKSGFVSPIEKWLANEWQPLLRDYLTADFCDQTEVLRWVEIERLIAKQATGKFDYAYPLFVLLVFAVWWKVWIAQTDLADPQRPVVTQAKLILRIPQT
jgi:asparagine synthase (glutamine-hydrolysing)